MPSPSVSAPAPNSPAPSPSIAEPSETPSDIAITEPEATAVPEPSTSAQANATQTPESDEPLLKTESLDQGDTPVQHPEADGEPGGIGVFAVPTSNSDDDLIAWIGDVAEPATKVTLAQALASGGIVNVVPNESGYRFNRILVVSSNTTLIASSATPIYGRVTVTGTGLAMSGAVLAAAANSQTQISVTGSGAVLTDVVVTNPEGFTGTTAISIAATAVDTRLVRLTVTGAATGVNLLTSGGTVIDGGSITGVTNGIISTLTSTGTGPSIDGTEISFTAKGLTLGSTTAASISNVEMNGPGSGTTYGIDYQNASGVVVTAPVITGVLHGISTSTPTTTASGPHISGADITATGNAIGLGATSGSLIEDVTLTRIEPTNNAAAIGINILNATDVAVDNPTISGFRDGISVAAGNNAAGLTISRGTIAAVINAVNLGGSVDARVTSITANGQARPAVTVVTTTAIELAGSSGTNIADLTATNVARGVNAPVANTTTGLVISDSDITLTDAAAAIGINLGGTEGAELIDLTISGVARTISRTTGISTNRASAAIISNAVIGDVATGIGGVWERLSGRDIPGHTITNATITNTGIGIYTANTNGTNITSSSVDAWGEGIAGHEDANITVKDTVVVGHTGTTFQNGTNCIRFYYTDGVTVVDTTTESGATGLYLDMSMDVNVARMEISKATWYATYAESIDGFTLSESRIVDNAGIGNLTINPTEIDDIDHRQVSSDIVFEDSTFADNIAGLYLPLGASDVTFHRNAVMGTSTYVLLGTPIHNLVFADNQVTFTHDPDQMSFAGILSDAPSLGDPPEEPPITDEVEEGLPLEAEIEQVAASVADLSAIVAPASATPPENATAAVWVAPLWNNLDTDSASSDNIEVLNNTFSGDGPFVGVGTTSETNKESPLAPANPSLARTLRDTIDVSDNVFPAPSTAIVTVDNAERGDDGDSSNQMINSDAAVDARGDNDWGSPCYARVPTDNYDGGGAYIHEVRVNQVLYPTLCEPQPTPTPSPEPTPTPTPTPTPDSDPDSGPTPEPTPAPTPAPAPTSSIEPDSGQTPSAYPVADSGSTGENPEGFSGAIARTGVNSSLALAIAGSMVFAGLVTLLVARRRRVKDATGTDNIAS
jgi:hypothetical protein